MANVLPTGHLLKKLRCLMQTSSAGVIHAYIVPSGDAHQSEYIADCDARRQFISKFTGSNGTAVVTMDKAALWTDGRYHLQASKQLELTNWELMKDGLPDTPTQGDWLKDVLESGNKVGVDPMLMSHDSWKKLSKDLRSCDITLVPVQENLIDQVWENVATLLPSDTPRPSRPCNKLIKLDIDITGKDYSKKIEELRDDLKKKKCGAIVLTALDDIAWLLNLRGSDIDFNPVFFSYCIVTLDKVVLFIDKAKLSSEVEQSIEACYEECPPSNKSCVQIKPYEDVVKYIQQVLLTTTEGSIWIMGGSSEAIFSSIPTKQRFVQASPVTKAKAIKNETEINNMKACHVRDAAALCEYLCWLEKMVKSHPDGHEQLWEIQGADYLENCRKQQKHFMGLSFPSISGSGPNGAVIHYHPEEATKRPISSKELYLIDSGAQYLDGTTDVTRTVFLGDDQGASPYKHAFTCVLKGHIQLAQANFPRGIKGSQLDTLARQPLWNSQMDYLHGTGHGVGMFLNVHEGPSSISPRQSPDDPGLAPGQILSNEPGYYEDGQYGIRIESLVVTRDTGKHIRGHKDRNILNFETITLVPIQLELIKTEMLSDDEISWINSYHDKCRDEVGAYLDEIGKKEVREWLNHSTRKLTR